MELIKSIFSSFTIWVLTALLNAVLSGTVVSFSSSGFSYWPTAILVVFILTLIFSIPGIFLFWITLLVNWEAEGLFRILLRLGFIVSILSSLLIYVLPMDMEIGQLLLLSLCMVIATVTSIMLHHSIFNAITTKNKNEHYV